MLTHEKLQQKPATFRAMTGFTVAEFETLFLESHNTFIFLASCHRKARAPQRRAGAGRPPKLTPRNQLLLLLIWLRLYPTYEALGVLFDLDKSNICRTLARWREALELVSQRELQWPQDWQRKRQLDEVLADFPEVQVILDATEQPVRRPQEPQARRAYYSGKRKRHTIKTQIAIAKDGYIREVSASVPGSVHDLTLLRQSGQMSRWEADEEVLADRGYQGAQDECRTLLHLPHKRRRGQALTEDEKAWNRLVHRCRVRVEHTLAACKRFQVLQQVYRHAREGDNTTFRVVATMVNYQGQWRRSLAR